MRQYIMGIPDDLIEAAKLDPKNVKIVLINDPEINAFVAGGQVERDREGDQQQR